MKIIQQIVNSEPSVKKFVQDILKKPELKNLEIYLVGGMVRDALLGKKSKDFDFVFKNISKSKLEKALKSLKGHVDLVGKNFGVYKFMPGNSNLKEPIDIAFPRTEFAAGTGGYKDFKIQADPKLPIEDDLSRRDFTINAIAYNIKTSELIDPFNGQKDLKNQIIKTVRDPKERFKEDYSRMLRAIRFSCQLNFKIEDKTWQAIIKNAKHLNDTRTINGKKELVIPEDTVRREMLKTLAANSLLAFDLYDQAGLWDQIIPELKTMKGCDQPPQFHSEGDVWTHVKLSLSKINSKEFKKIFPKAKISGEFVLALILHDIGKPKASKIRKVKGKNKITFYDHHYIGSKMAEEIYKRLCFSKKQTEKIKFLIENHMKAMIGDPNELKNTTIEKYFFGPHGHELLMLFYLDSSASLRPNKKPALDKFNKLLKRIKSLEKIKEKQKNIPVELLDGIEIMKILNKKQGGPYIEKAKEMIREKQLAGKITDKKQAKVFARQNKKEIMTDSKKLIIISGPSGVGKTTIINRLLKKHPHKLQRILTYTTRPPRKKHEEKGEYKFFTESEFKELISQNGMIEWEKVYGNYYGKSFMELEKIWQKDKMALATIDPLSIDKKEFKKAFITVIFITAQLKNIENRLKKRSPSGDIYQKRKKLIPQELKMAKKAKYIVKNEENKISQTVKQCEKIIFSQA